ncbi:MAG: protein kinase, partial [Thermoanaerobaculia bacterium]
RTDIWAFGVVLWEMLTGEQIFAGPTVTDVLAAVLKTELDWNLVPEGVPTPIRTLLRRCLERDSQLRLRDIGEARIILEGGTLDDPGAEVSSQRNEVPKWRRVLPWAVALGALILAVGLQLEDEGAAPTSPVPATTFTVLTPEAHSLPNDTSPTLDISADGRTLVFVAEGESGKQIFRRSLDRLEVVPIDGTRGAQHPLISPDGRWVAFFANGSLKRVPIEGGVPLTLAEAANNRGAAWSPRGSIVLTPTFDSGLVEVPATGGEMRVLTTLNETAGERTHRWPQVLPDGNSVLFTVGDLMSPGDYDSAKIDIVRLDSGERKTVLEGARMARYVEPGYLLFQRETTLLAQAFDLERLETVSEPFSIQERVGGEKSSGAGFFAAVGSTLVLVPQDSIPNERHLAMVERDGREQRLALSPDRFVQPRFSPDGNRIAFVIGSGAAADDDIWIYDLQSERLDRLTFGKGNGMPIWSPDGKRIVFVRGGTGETGLFWKPSDGSGRAERFWEHNQGVLIPNSWLPGSRTLAFTSASGTVDVYLLELDESWHAVEAAPLLTNPWVEWGAEFSVDGRYVAYASLETGIFEVFVQSYPSGGKWQVSEGEGRSPVWSRDGKKLFFAQGDTMMEVSVDTTGVFRAGTPQPLFAGPYYSGAPIRDFDVGPDGRFVLIRRTVDATVPLGLKVIQNWAATLPEELRAR